MSDRLDSVNLVVNYIRKGIISGSWPIGEKIPSENELCSELGIGRASVRDALAQYVAFGLLKSVHGKGTFVCSDDLPSFGSGDTTKDLPEIIIPVLEFRHMLEPEICYHATLNSSPELLSALEDSLLKMNNSVKSVKDFFHNDMNFHLEIAKATKNAIAFSVMTDIFQKNAASFYLLNQTIGACNAIYYHTQILDAMKEQDSKSARSLMNEHLEKTISELTLVKK